MLFFFPLYCCIVEIGDIGWAGNLIFLSLSVRIAFLFIVDGLTRPFATLYHHLLHYIVLTLTLIYYYKHSESATNSKTAEEPFCPVS